MFEANITHVAAHDAAIINLKSNTTTFLKTEINKLANICFNGCSQKHYGS